MRSPKWPSNLTCGSWLYKPQNRTPKGNLITNSNPNYATKSISPFTATEWQWYDLETTLWTGNRAMVAGDVTATDCDAIVGNTYFLWDAECRRWRQRKIRRTRNGRENGGKSRAVSPTDSASAFWWGRGRRAGNGMQRYVIGLTGIIYEKGCRTGGRRRVDASGWCPRLACRDWTRLADDAGRWRQSPKLPSSSPRPSFVRPDCVGAEQNGDIRRNPEEKLPAGVNESVEQVHSSGFLGRVDCWLRSTWLELDVLS